MVLAQARSVKQSPDALVTDAGVLFDQGKGLGHDLGDGALPGEASEVGPKGPQVLVVSCGDLEVAGQ